MPTPGLHEVLKRARKLSRPYRAADGRGFRRKVLAIPAPHRWYQQMIVGAAMMTGLAELDPGYSEISAEQRAALVAEE